MLNYENPTTFSTSKALTLFNSLSQWLEDMGYSLVLTNRDAFNLSSGSYSYCAYVIHQFDETKYICISMSCYYGRCYIAYLTDISSFTGTETTLSFDYITKVATKYIQFNISSTPSAGYMNASYLYADEEKNMQVLVPVITYNDSSYFHGLIMQVKDGALCFISGIGSYNYQTYRQILIFTADDVYKRYLLPFARYACDNLYQLVTVLVPITEVYASIQNYAQGALYETSLVYDFSDIYQVAPHNSIYTGSNHLFSLSNGSVYFRIGADFAVLIAE